MILHHLEAWPKVIFVNRQNKTMKKFKKNYKKKCCTFFTGTPAENLPKFVIGIFLDMLALPFLFICSMSLYTKLLPKEIQGKFICCNRH